MSDQQLANAPEARTETGEIKDQATGPLTTPSIETKKETLPSTDTTSTESTSSTTQTPTDAPKTEPSLLNQDDKKGEDKTPALALGVYTPFTVPEGYELNPEVATEASGIFKKLGLNQEQAQELVNFYSKQTESRDSSSATAAETAWQETNKAWQAETLADPDLGPNISKVKETISRALDSLGDAALTKDFKQVMDMTGAGNHKSFVKAFYQLAQRATEGRHVKGTGPTTESQRAPGQGRPTAAQALYPNLTSSNG